MRNRLRATALTAALLLVSACSADAARDAVAPDSAAVLSASVEDKATDVAIDQPVTVEVADGTLSAVTLTGAEDAEIDGEIADGTWTAAERLEPGTTYRLTAQARGEDGEDVTMRRTFTTQQLTLDQQTYPAVAPLQGETVGVGMPVIVSFDLPVRDRRLFEQHMHVRSQPEVEGSWTWFSDNVAHWRPKEYWPAGTKVTVELDVNSLPAGNGIYGQQDQLVEFEVGSRVVSTVDVAAHTMTVEIDGSAVRTIPVSTGKPGHESRRGTKLIMEKYPSVDMDAATTGVSEDDPDYYDISDVRWAMRLTNSGEFVHAAPWSVGAQGSANVSHGCTGMSTADAKWFYDRSKRGDVVVFVNSARPLEDRNGWTDWNVDWNTWTAGSALT